MLELVSFEATQMGGIIDRVPMIARMQMIPGLFVRLDEALDRANVFYAGPQTALYRIHGEEMEVRVGVPLFRPIEGFEMFEAPAGQGLCERVLGPLDDLPATYRAITDEINARGMARGVWARETYRFIARDTAMNVTDVSIDITDRVH
ncbi:hypothetical protein [Tateyamaria sp.]|uniref:hypothetical protein n=1 Tax=Tateyamaria sp. TaxID=1929288 RepID=UPI00329FBA8F